MIAVIDCGQDVTRLISFLEQENCRFEVAKDPEPILRAQRVILYGDGSFPEAMYQLEKRGFAQILRENMHKNTGLLGINLGMELFFTSSGENGYYQGLNLIPGHVIPYSQTEKFKGEQWLLFNHLHPLFYGLHEGEVYFSRLSVLQDYNAEDVIAAVEVEDGFLPAIVARHSVLGMRFDPTMSGSLGQELLKRFLSWEFQTEREE